MHRESYDPTWFISLLPDGRLVYESSGNPHYNQVLELRRITDSKDCGTPGWFETRDLCKGLVSRGDQHFGVPFEPSWTRDL